MPSFARLALIALVSAGTAFAAETPADKALAEVRSLAAGREILAAKEALKKAAAHKGDAKFDEEYERLDLLMQYLEQFWQWVERGAAKLQGVDELVVGDQRVAVVEIEGPKLILRVAGQNKTYTPQNIPPKLAMVIAESAMKKGDAAGQACIGAFLAMDAKGDRDKAREYWTAASRGGVDVKLLLPELGTAKPSPPVEIPTLNPGQRAFLDPKQWQLRVKGDKGWVRKPLESAKQNDEGRLIFEAGEGESQVLFKRPLMGDFVCRLIVKDARDGQRVGIVGTSLEDVGYYLNVPEGTSLIEIMRKGAVWTAKIGEANAELEAAGRPADRMQGALALSLPTEGTLTIAALDFAAK